MVLLYLFTINITSMIMIGVGLILKYFTPLKISHFVGYRTKKSMKNNRTWIYAQYFSGKQFIMWGIISFALSSIIVLFTHLLHIFPHIFLFLCILQFLAIIIVIIKTENELGKKFPEN